MVLTGSADEDAGTWPMAGGELSLELNEPLLPEHPSISQLLLSTCLDSPVWERNAVSGEGPL